MTPNPDQAPDQALICNMLAVIAERLGAGQTCLFIEVYEDHSVCETDPQTCWECLRYMSLKQLIKMKSVLFGNPIEIKPSGYPDAETPSRMNDILHDTCITKVTDEGMHYLEENCNR